MVGQHRLAHETIEPDVSTDNDAISIDNGDAPGRRHFLFLENLADFNRRYGHRQDPSRRVHRGKRIEDGDEIRSVGTSEKVGNLGSPGRQRPLDRRIVAKRRQGRSKRFTGIEKRHALGVHQHHPAPVHLGHGSTVGVEALQRVLTQGRRRADGGQRTDHSLDPLIDR